MILPRRPTARVAPLRPIRGTDRLLALGLVLGTLAGAAPAATRYVRWNSVSPVSPYTSWATAATTIQAAIARSAPGDSIVVSNGVYRSGQAYATAGMSSRVALTNAVAVRSLNGPAVTSIEGAGPMGIFAVRCAYVGAGSALIGFTLTNGVTRDASVANAEMSGGGAWCEPGGLLSNCVVVGCVAAYAGGGVYHGDVRGCTLAGNVAAVGAGLYGGSAERCVLQRNRATQRGAGAMLADLRNCLLSANEAPSGAGAASSALVNCTVAGNAASQWGGGTENCELRNSVVYDNTAPTDANGTATAGIVQYTCMTPAPAGAGNVGGAPLFVDGLAGNYRLQATSPCLNAGSDALANAGVDLDGLPRIMEAHVDLGAYEFHRITVSPTNANWGAAGGTGAVVVAASSGYPWTVTAAAPWLTVVGSGKGVGGGGFQYVVAANSGSGRGASLGVAERLVNVVQAAAPAIRATYVSLDGRHLAPFDTWYKAATTLQAAVDAAPASGVVWVSNGYYRVGGMKAVGTSLNIRVGLNRGISLRSLYGTGRTWIIGKSAGGTIPGRCAWVSAGCTLEGFTLAEGVALDDYGMDGAGAGAVVEPGGLLLKCVIRDCVTLHSGGGAYGNGIGGYGSLSRCVLYRNRAQYGGGAFAANLYDCLMVSNSASFGGGLMYGTLNDCTVVGNSAVQGGGTYGSSVRNCVVYDNRASGGPANCDVSIRGSIDYTCTTPLPASGTGNLTNSPLLRAPQAWDWRLQASSPCIDRGSNAEVGSPRDLDGQIRILGPAVDLGAYEYWASGADSNTNAVPDDWELRHFGCLDHVNDTSDWDGDRLADRAEYRAGTDPTNWASCLRFLDVRRAGADTVVRWQGVPGKWYRLSRSGNLRQTWASAVPIRTGIAGRAPMNTVTDATATGRGPWLYRVQLE